MENIIIIAHKLLMEFAVHSRTLFPPGFGSLDHFLSLFIAFYHFFFCPVRVGLRGFYVKVMLKHTTAVEVD